MSSIEIPRIGEVLKEDFLDPLKMSHKDLAFAIHVQVNEVDEIVSGARSLSEEMDLRLTKYFNLSEGYFLRLQSRFKLMRGKVNVI